MSDAVLVALIAAIGSTTAAIVSAIALRQSRSTHMLINSRMDEFLLEARKASRAEGVAAGEQSQRDRDQPPRPHTPIVVVGNADPDAEPIRTVQAEERK